MVNATSAKKSSTRSSAQKLQQIRDSLLELGISRQANIGKETLDVFSERLKNFEEEDVVSACEKLSDLPREEGKPSMPDLGTILAMVRCETYSRINRAKPQEDVVIWRCPVCGSRVSGYRARGQALEDTPKVCTSPYAPIGQIPRSLPAKVTCGGIMSVVRRQEA
jgi:hypothetical protein